MQANNNELVNGVERTIEFGCKYAVGDVVERWHIDGEGGNSTVQYSSYCASRAAAKAALAASEFPYCPIGSGGPVIGQSRITFTVRSARPYNLIGKRMTVTGIDQYGQMRSYTDETIEVVRIVDGRLTDKSGMTPVE